MNAIKELMQVDIFTSSEFNKKLNETLKHGWNSRVTLDFLCVAESLGMVKCLGHGRSNQYTWEIVSD